MRTIDTPICILLQLVLLPVAALLLPLSLLSSRDAVRRDDGDTLPCYAWRQFFKSTDVYPRTMERIVRMLKLVIVRYVYIYLWFSSTIILGSTAGPGHSFANRYFVADIWRSPGPKGHQQLPLLLGAMVAWQPLAVRIVQRITVYNIKGYLFTVTDQFIRWNKRDVENLRKIYDYVIELCVLWRCKFLLRQPVVEWDTPEDGVFHSTTGSNGTLFKD